MTILEIIDKHKINTSELARKVEITEKTFTNKLRGRLNSYFTPDEITRIKKALGEMGVDLVNYSKSKADL